MVLNPMEMVFQAGETGIWEYWVSLHPISNPSIFCLRLFHKQITAVKQNFTGLVATLYQTCF